MKSALKLFMALLMFGAISGHALAGDPLAVIVNIKNPITSITENQLRRIYEDRMLKWENGTPITVYDLSVNDPLRESFSRKIFGSPSEKIAEMWAHLKITNQAKNPPITMKSEYVIMKMVSAEEGAIGYVSLNTVKTADIQGFKILGILTAPD